MAALPVLVIFTVSETHNLELNLNELIYIHKMHIFSLICKQLHVNVKANDIMINVLPMFWLIFFNIVV